MLTDKDDKELKVRLLGDSSYGVVEVSNDDGYSSLKMFGFINEKVVNKFWRFLLIFCVYPGSAPSVFF